jgi:hypothetical protein
MNQKPQSNTSRRPSGRSGATCAGSVAKPTVTRPSSVQPDYVASKSTNPGMLHQSRALKASAADTARDRSETGGGRRATGKLTGNIVEVSGVAQATPVTPFAHGDAGEITGRKASVSQGQNRVFVLGKGQSPLMPCHPARARELLRKGQAVIHRRYPFIIRLKTRTTGTTQPVVVKQDPGASTTGFAVVRLHHLNPKLQSLLFLCELTHRGFIIRDSLTQRKGFRRGRRSRNLRYRAPRFLNRGGDKLGWLPPSLRHRVETCLSWVRRFQRWVPITSLEMELVRFDLQLMANPDITGAEYQQGTLAGYEVREYVFEKWGRHCAYCDKEHGPLNLDHVISKARGGSNRVSNLVPSCIPCNEQKDQQDVRIFLAKDPVRLARIQAGATKPMAAAAAVNATRFALLEALRATGLPVTTGTGGRTKWNRSRFSLPKTHALDAACVGEVDSLTGAGITPLSIRCMGRGSRKRTRFTAYGFPRGKLSPAKAHFGFRTGDMVRAKVPDGKYAGIHTGRVAVRKSGSFNIQTAAGTVQGIAHRHCRKLQAADGYNYHLQPSAIPPHALKGVGFLASL